MEDIKNALINYDIEKFNKLINELDKTIIYNDKDLSIFKSLFDICFKYNRTDEFKILYDKWTLPDLFQDFSLILWMFINVNFTSKELKFACDILDYSYVDIVDELIYYDSNYEILLAMKKCDEIFEKQSNETYGYLMDLANVENNSEVFNYLIDKFVAGSDYAQTPEWIKDFTNNNMPTEDEIDRKRLINIKITIEDVNKLSLDEMIKLLTASGKELGLTEDTIEQSKEYFRKIIPSMDDKEKYMLMKDILKIKKYNEEQDNIDSFRLYGPDNPLVETSYSELKDRRSRMFYCNYFDFDEDEQEFYDWFIGFCEICYKRIKYRWYAVRLPLPHGGFRGCYCSHQCLQDAVTKREEDRGEPDMALRIMVDDMISDLKKYGIQQRKV